MRRERARADRNGGGLCLVVYRLQEPVDPSEPAAGSDLLLRVLQERLRLTDDIGWLRSGLLGVLLPHTDRRGAESFAHTVAREAADAGLADVDAVVYAYPDAWVGSPSRGVAAAVGQTHPVTVQASGPRGEDGLEPLHVFESASKSQAPEAVAVES